jgi:hypothetical protein
MKELLRGESTISLGLRCWSALMWNFTFYTTVTAEQTQNISFWLNEEEKRFAIYSSIFIALAMHQEPEQSTQHCRIWNRNHNHVRLVMIIYNTPQPKHTACVTLMNTIFTWIWDNSCLVHHPKMEGCLIIGHKVKHVQYTYFNENQRLWGGLSYIQANTVTWNRLQRSS